MVVMVLMMIMRMITNSNDGRNDGLMVHDGCNDDDWRLMTY